MKYLLLLVFLLVPITAFGADKGDCYEYNLAIPEFNFERYMDGETPSIRWKRGVEPDCSSWGGEVDDWKAGKEKRSNWRDKELRDKLDCETMRLNIAHTDITIDMYPQRIQDDYNNYCSIAPISFVVK